MDTKRLEVLMRQIEASKSIMERITEQMSALGGELLSMKWELDVLSKAVSDLKNEGPVSETDNTEAEEKTDDYVDEEETDDSIDDICEMAETAAAECIKTEKDTDEASSFVIQEGKLTVGDRFGQRNQQENLNEKFENRFKASLSRNISLNDRFRFQRELFHGSQGEMNEVLATIENCTSIGEAWDFVCHKLDENVVNDPDNAVLQDFRHLLELHFS